VYPGCGKTLPGSDRDLPALDQDDPAAFLPSTLWQRIPSASGRCAPAPHVGSVGDRIVKAFANAPGTTSQFWGHGRVRYPGAHRRGHAGSPVAAAIRRDAGWLRAHRRWRGRSCACWVAQASRRRRPDANRRAGGGLVGLYWAAPTILNPHLRSRRRTRGPQLFNEPLADTDTNIVPALAQETRASPTAASDGRHAWVAQKRALRRSPHRDTHLTWQYALDQASATTSTGPIWDRARRESTITP
jgi:hypothetical protein